VSVTLDGGEPIPNDQTTYTLATSDFLATGGDGYTMLADGQGVSRDKMADVLSEHIRTLSTLAPAVDGRIRDLAVTP
jgi:2',3'-cyclic-nucleotide 2'-phosphodiesterase (5'-nucleotidase family)